MRHRGVLGVAAAASLAAALAGCSRGKSEVNEPHEKAETPPPQSGAQAACAEEIALECPDGMADGCTRKTGDGAPLTAYHVCLPAEEQASQPCEQEIARECGEGLVDACLVDPPAAATHLCVKAAASAEPPMEEPGESGEKPDEAGEKTEG